MAKRRRSRSRRRGASSRINPMANSAKATIAIGVLTMLGSGIYALYDRQKKGKGCGSRYQYLAVTVGGQDFDDGYGWWGTSQDYSEWKDLAEQLSALAISHFVELGRVECTASGGTDCTDPEDASSPSWARYNALLPQKNALVAKTDNMGSVWFTLDIPSAVSRAKAVITDALCLLERADDGIKAYGAIPPVIPDSGPRKRKIPLYAWTGLGGAALAAAGIVVGQVVQAPAPASTTVVVDRGATTRRAAQDWVR